MSSAPARRLRAAVPAIRHTGHRRPEVGLSGLDAVRKAAKKGRSIKNQLRSVERLLAKPDLPLDVRRAAQRRLEELRSAESDQSRRDRERRLAQRSHKARFFERVKIERVVKRCEKEVADAERRLATVSQGADADAEGEGEGEGEGAEATEAVEERALLEAALASARERLASAEGDLSYVVNFPPGEAYVPLLRDPEGSEENRQRVLCERQRLRAMVRDRLAETALLTEGDEGRRKSSQKTAAAAQASGDEAPRRREAEPSVGDKGEASEEEKEASIASDGAFGSDSEDDFFLPDGGEDGDAVSSPASFEAAGGVVDFEAIQKQAAEEARAKRRAKLGKDKTGLGAASEGELQAWEREDQEEEEDADEKGEDDGERNDKRRDIAKKKWEPSAKSPRGNARRDSGSANGNARRDSREGNRSGKPFRSKPNFWGREAGKEGARREAAAWSRGGDRRQGDRRDASATKPWNVGKDGKPYARRAGDAKARTPLGPKGGVAKKASADGGKTPVRTRAEGGRKRRSKNKE